MIYNKYVNLEIFTCNKYIIINYIMSHIFNYKNSNIFKKKYQYIFILRYTFFLLWILGNNIGQKGVKEY